MREKLTVIIPCKNERLNIRPCIESLRQIADEIIAADSGSTDGTLAIVRQMGGCRIIERAYIDAGNFRNWAIPQASHPWVLIVDADERVTVALAEEIATVLAAPKSDGYRIVRRNFCFGHEIKHCGWNRDAVLRLFRRDQGRYGDGSDRAEVHVRFGRVGALNEKLIHYSCWSIEQYLRKADRYTTQTAQWRARHGRRANWAGMLLRGPMRFLHLYVLRLGFLDGMPGLIICGLTASNSFLKMAKLWTLHEGLPQPNPEAQVGPPLSSRIDDTEVRSAA